MSTNSRADSARSTVRSAAAAGRQSTPRRAGGVLLVSSILALLTLAPDAATARGTLDSTTARGATALGTVGTTALGTTAPGTVGTADAARDRRRVLGGARAADTVRGVVFDSLGNAPLADALVTAEPGGASTVTDSLGRFVLVSDVRVAQLAAYHESLDLSGISGLSAMRPPEAARWNDAVLTTPSLESVWRGVCNAEPESEERSGVVVGTTVMPDNRTRVAGARVRVQYQVILAGSGMAQIQERSTDTDSLGNFAICGAPSVGEMAILATDSMRLQSSPVLFEMVDRPIRRVDLVLGPLDGPMTRWPTAEGVVTSEDGTPIPQAYVNINGRDSVVQTGADGRFRVPQVPLGSRMLTVQAEGHIPASTQLNILYDEIPELNISLAKTLTFAGLEGIQITERTAIRAARRAYEERKKSGVALFVDSSEVTAAGSLRAALAQIEGLQVTRALASDDSTHYEVLGRTSRLGVQTCQAFLFLDGEPVEAAAYYPVPAEAIASIEVYRSAGRTPAPFSQLIDEDCSVVLVWSRFGLRP